MQVLSWNVWWRFGPWEDRQPAIVSELRRVDPDVVALQEVWAVDGIDQLDGIRRATGWQVARTVDAEGGPQEFGNAVLSRWPVTVLEQVDLPGPSGRPSHRSALACLVDAPTGPLVTVVTHLAWQYDQSSLRQEQLALVASLVERHRPRGTDPDPVVLAGDLNAVPESDEIRRLTGLAPPYQPGLVFTDCWAAVGDGPGHTWTRDNPHADEALWPRRRLDYVLVSWPRGKPYGNPLSARLVGTDPVCGTVPSDHYGVVVELDDRRPEVAHER